MYKNLLLLCLLALLASCATQGIRVPVMMPAAVNLVQFDRVAVDRFQGEGCEQFSDQLAAALGTAVNPMTGKQGFAVLHRKDVDRALDQIRDRHGAEWDARTMALLDQWRTAPVVLKGRMQRHDVEAKVVEERVKDAKGGVTVRHKQVLTACVDVQLEATDVGGNRVFDSATLTSSLSASRCVEDDPHGVLDPLPLLAAARAQVVQRYLDRVLPHQEWVAVNLYQDGAFPDLQVGNGYAEVGNWAEAAEAYQRALQAMTGEQGQKRYMGLFNLGVACEFSDRFDDARNALQEAYALGRDQMILRELQRASAREGEVQRLRQQGAPAQPAR